MEQPLVSLIICTQNRFELLKLAVKNAFEQSYQNIEVIVILGNQSIDKSRLFLQSLVQDKVIRMSVVSNRIEARNEGWKMATGKYVCYLDDDDAILNDKIEKQVNYMEANPKVSVLSAPTMLGEKCGFMHTFKDLKHSDIIRLLEEGYNIDEIMNFQSCMFRKEDVDSIFNDKPVFDELFIGGGEGQFLLYNIIFSGKVVENVPNTLYVYNAGAIKNSLSANVIPDFYNNNLLNKSFDDRKTFVKTFYDKFPLKETTEERLKTPTKPIHQVSVDKLNEFLNKAVHNGKSFIAEKKGMTLEELEESEKPKPVIVEEKPKRSRKKKETTVTEDKPKRGRKKKVEEPQVETIKEEKPKRGRKKKVEEPVIVEEKPKRGRKKKVEEPMPEVKEEAPKKRGRKKKE